MINQYILTDEKINFGNLVEDKERSEIAEQLNKLTNEEQSEIIYQLFNNKKKYLRFNRWEGGEGKEVYIFSVITIQLAQFDRAYFEGKFRVEGEKISINDNVIGRVIDSLYKPYYCEATVEIRAENKELAEIVAERRNGEWNLIREYDEPTDRSFPIEIHFSASPYKIKRMYAEWASSLGEEEKKEVESVLDQFEGKDLDYSAQPDGKQVFDSIFQNVTRSNIHVLRVGQASANYGFTMNTKIHKYYFDVGLPVDGNMLTGDGLRFLEEKIVNGYFGNVEPEAVILSHWHSDHVKGAFTMKEVAGTVWLAPIFKVSRQNNPDSVNRLGSYIYSKKKLARVQAGQNPIYVCGDFSLYHGVGSRPNDIGFMLQLNSTLMPGDCQFNFWPQGFGKKVSNLKYKYQYLVFPHHGAAMEDKNNRMDCLQDSQNTKVIVPTGYNFRYGHPSDNKNIFSGKNYTVFPTNPIDKKENNEDDSIFIAYFNRCIAARSDCVDQANTVLTRTENQEFSIRDL